MRCRKPCARPVDAHSGDGKASAGSVSAERIDDGAPFDLAAVAHVKARANLGRPPTLDPGRTIARLPALLGRAAAPEFYVAGLRLAGLSEGRREGRWDERGPDPITRRRSCTDGR
jgi:hypothetical protein